MSSLSEMGRLGSSIESCVMARAGPIAAAAWFKNVDHPPFGFWGEAAKRRDKDETPNGRRFGALGEAETPPVKQMAAV
jgi:hypothetical protein